MRVNSETGTLQQCKEMMDKSNLLWCLYSKRKAPVFHTVLNPLSRSKKMADVTYSHLLSSLTTCRPCRLLVGLDVSLSAALHKIYSADFVEPLWRGDGT